MKQKYINYVGPSMNPLLVDGDGLNVVPYENRAIKRGDVIVFVAPGNETKIVHRVVSCDGEGIRTRGDNCNRVDPWVLAPVNILGRVTYIKRRNRRRTIRGGLLGIVAAYGFRCRRLCSVTLCLVLRPGYRVLCCSAVLRNRLHRLVKPKVLAFKRPEGTELQLVIGLRPIGRRRPGTSGWEIKRPFRLCVDENLLPAGDSYAETKGEDECRRTGVQNVCSTRH